ncbi:MAG: hypothetical protein ACK42Z_02095 [Candidatus Kapaibacteriota bacterium]
MDSSLRSERRSQLFLGTGQEATAPCSLLHPVLCNGIRRSGMPVA